ncbi:MAG: hypothetical protein K2K48_06350 [Anaeroplasmataceae bacterium]|nr:hypothetical protein [Anaeroplasmataceae bacterium]
MRRKLTGVLLLGFVFLLVFLTGCSDHKSPMKGYITDDEISQIVSKFATETKFTKYSYEGNLNYFGYADELVPQTVSKRNVDFVDSLEEYSDKCSSYYLRLPLHITVENWNTNKTVSGTADGLSLSTRYQLEAKIYRPKGYDSVYYYAREDGGLILRAFGVNKALTIKRPSDITCRGKWDIEIEYDANGYLVREYFSTINKSEKNKSSCCYGEAKYTYA